MDDAITTLTSKDLAGPTGAALVALNNLHAEELSWLEADRLAQLVGWATAAHRVGEADALLLAFDQDAAYDGVNFRWFRARYERFVYVDRIVVAEAARGRGLARALYLNLFEKARSADHQRVVCEVNTEPPNPASVAFHTRLDFRTVGTGVLPAGKRVAYFERTL